MSFFVLTLKNKPCELAFHTDDEFAAWLNANIKGLLISTNTRGIEGFRIEGSVTGRLPSIDSIISKKQK